MEEEEVATSAARGPACTFPGSSATGPAAWLSARMKVFLATSLLGWPRAAGVRK